jgi:hypothetical protein
MKDLKIQLNKQENNTVIDFKLIVSSEYHDFLNVFFKKKTNILSLHKKHDHRIKLKKDKKFDHEYASLYNLSKNELLLIKNSSRNIWKKISLNQALFYTLHSYYSSQSQMKSFVSA